MERISHNHFSISGNFGIKYIVMFVVANDTITGIKAFFNQRSFFATRCLRKGSRSMEVKIIVQDKENKEMHINEYENFAELLVDVVNKLDLDVSEVIIKKEKTRKD